MIDRLGPSRAHAVGLVLEDQDDEVELEAGPPRSPALAFIMNPPSRTHRRDALSADAALTPSRRLLAAPWLPTLIVEQQRVRHPVR